LKDLLQQQSGPERDEEIAAIRCSLEADQALLCQRRMQQQRSGYETQDTLFFPSSLDEKYPSFKTGKNYIIKQHYFYPWTQGETDPDDPSNSSDNENRGRGWKRKNLPRGLPAPSGGKPIPKRPPERFLPNILNYKNLLETILLYSSATSVTK